MDVTHATVQNQQVDCFMDFALEKVTAGAVSPPANSSSSSSSSRMTGGVSWGIDRETSLLLIRPHLTGPCCLLAAA